MKYEDEVKRTLKTDNKISFVVGSDIAFTILNSETNYHDRYIGEIKEITDTTITIKRIEINRNQIGGEMVINLSDIESNSCNYVYVD